LRARSSMDRAAGFDPANWFLPGRYQKVAGSKAFAPAQIFAGMSAVNPVGPVVKIWAVPAH